MSSEKQGSDAAGVGTGGPEQSKWPSLPGVTPYEVARLAIELSKIPEVVTENPTWGDRSLLAIYLLELAQEQLTERQRPPVNRFFNEPLAYWWMERDRRITFYDQLYQEVNWKERSNSESVPLAKAARQITHSKRSDQAVNKLELLLTFLVQCSPLSYVRQDAESWLKSKSVPEGQIECLRILSSGFEKAYRHTLSKVKGQMGGKAKAEKKKKPVAIREESAPVVMNGLNSLGAQQKHLGSQKKAKFRKKSS